MTRMTSRPPIGALLREGMRRKGLRQAQLAEMIGASRSAVNAWINDRSWPQDYQIGALEEALGVEIPREQDAGGEAGEDDLSRERLHRSLDHLSGAELAELARALNAIRDSANSSNPRRERAG